MIAIGLTEFLEKNLDVRQFFRKTRTFTQGHSQFMKHVLIKASIDWADEFECQMFGVFTKDKWEQVKESAKLKIHEGYMVGFGTNEELDFENYENWLKKFSVTEISEEQAAFLKLHFGETWGTGSNALRYFCE